MKWRVCILLYIPSVIAVVAVAFSFLLINDLHHIVQSQKETERRTGQLIVDLEEKLERRLAELKTAEAAIADLERQQE